VRRILEYPLWLGHSGDARDLAAVHAAGILAVVDLALDEPPAVATRDLVYCRFPLLDGPGNPSWLLRAAIETTALLIRSETPTLVACGLGMSRSPGIAAAAIARISGESAVKILTKIGHSGRVDVCPGLWSELVAALARQSDTVSE
jgi:hypothetical protein